MNTPVDRNSPLSLRPFASADLPAALRLTQAEKWSHRFEDWQLALRLGRGWAVVDGNAELLGTTLRWGYGPSLSTIGLVVVRADCQGRGIGRMLMNAAMAGCEQRTLQLTATLAGRRLYEQCGFVVAGAVNQRQGIPNVQAAPLPAGVTLRAATSADLEKLTALDTAAFGGPRAALLAAVLEEGKGLIASRDGTDFAFAMRRRAGRGLLIGPLVAPDAATAIALTGALLETGGEVCRIDIPADESEFGAWLEASGLPSVDEVTPMRRGQRAAPVAGAKTWALASQAFG